jgi:hypothetical protein
MELQELTPLLQRPETLNSEHTDAIKSIVNEYPYFQAARALYLKALKNSESYKYNNALKIAAVYTTNRSILFDFITSNVFNQNEISLHIKQNSEHIKAIEVNTTDELSVHKNLAINDELKQQILATKGVLDPSLFEEKQQKSITAREKMGLRNADVGDSTPETKLNIGKPLDFKTSETHSFAEWLKITSFKPIKRLNAEQTINTESKNKNDTTISPFEEKLAIIDKFILDNPKIKPVTSGSKPKLVNNYEAPEDNLMTETLARIYLEQKNYDKALQSYRILSLKYPEKSSFFANQIKAVKELKAHNND